MSEQTLIASPPAPRLYTNKEWLAFFLFWSWNLIFLAFMGFGFAPVLLPETFKAVRTGLIPVDYVVYVLVLALIPLGAVALGLTRLRREPARLLAMGYTVEGPLMLLLAVRLFLIRQATPAVTTLLLVALLGMAAFLWDVLSPDGRRLKWLRLVGLTMMAALSLYAAAWMAFYALPIGAEFFRWLWNVLRDLPAALRNLGRQLTFMFGNQLYMLPFSMLGFLLFIYSASLFVVAPIAVPFYSLRAWFRSISRLSDRSARVPPALLASITLVVVALVFMWSNRQPQGEAFALLKEPPTSLQQAQQLVGRSNLIRKGLLNAYLARYRYISAVGEVLHIRNLYESALNMTPEQAFTAQALYEGLARPLLYKPVKQSWSDNTALTKEPAEAAEMYERFFDTPINKGERRTVVAAARATWDPDASQAAWLAVDDREVYLVRQELELRPQGDWAELELHEVYANQTANQQEVVYYFSLPESAVITGLWLGNSADKSQAFQYQVAPRGAAQAVYREETRVYHDPALVEQIGPRQYRLRAYPVPPMRLNYDDNTGRSTIEAAEQLHLWLEWREMASSQGWPLPQMAELRNVYWDRGTIRLLNQSEMDVNGDDWLPAVVAEPQPAAPSAHRLDLPGGRSILAIPAGQVDLPAIPQDLRLAVVLDRSRSMEALAAEAAAALEALRPFDRPDSPVDVYLTSSPYRGEDPSVVSLGELKLDEILYFGGQNAAELLAQFESLRGERSYDAILVLTDGSGYELGEPPVSAPLPDAPVWMVHLGGFPLGYDDSTLEAIQASGGGVASSVDEALQRLAVSRSAVGDEGEIRDLVDGYLWLALPTDSLLAGEYAALPASTSNQGFAALAARSLVLAEIQRNRGAISQLDTLDYLHALAQEYSIVSPYSSMLVLVNSQQQALLDRLVQGEDRYDREVEAIGETSPGSPIPLAGVPEPHEWLLLGLVVAMLLYVAYTKRSELQIALSEGRNRSL
jgi:putative PEP-CTERM system integral membrane protein